MPASIAIARDQRTICSSPKTLGEKSCRHDDVSQSQRLILGDIANNQAVFRSSIEARNWHERYRNSQRVRSAEAADAIEALAGFQITFCNCQHLANRARDRGKQSGSR